MMNGMEKANYFFISKYLWKVPNNKGSKEISKAGGREENIEAVISLFSGGLNFFGWRFRAALVMRKVCQGFCLSLEKIFNFRPFNIFNHSGHQVFFEINRNSMTDLQS